MWRAPCRCSTTKPANRSTLRCCETAGLVTGSWAASAPTGLGCSATSSKIRRRVGSASAVKALATTNRKLLLTLPPVKGRLGRGGLPPGGTWDNGLRRQPCHAVPAGSCRTKDGNHGVTEIQDRFTSAEPHGRLRLATALSVASTLDEVAQVVGRWGPPVVGSSFANLAIFDPAANEVSVVHGPSLAPDIAQKWSRFPINTPTPLCTAILTGQAVLLPDVAAIERDYALLVGDTVAAGLQATASLPLRAEDGSTIGAIGLAWPYPQPFDPLQVSHLQVIVELVARAVQHASARSPEEESFQGMAGGLQSVHAFQEAILGRSLRHTPDLDVAAAYLPASDAPMGGDWYDVFRVDDATCLVVGDIAGHGIDATAAMAELKHALRAYAAEDPTPSTVVSRINRFVHHFHSGLTATLIVATWQPHTRTLWRCNAGHPAPLRYDPGPCGYLPLQKGPNLLLGVDPRYEYHQEANQLAAGTTLLLYSDGLVENPPESIDDTMQKLLCFCQQHPSLSPQRLINETVLWRLREGPARDDICVMAVRLA